MSDSKTIECKPSQWFKTRAIAVGLMLTFFSLWFFKDGYWSYREKNAEVVISQLFLGDTEDTVDKADFVVKAIDEFNKKEYTPETWVAFAKDQVVRAPDNKNTMPRDYDYSAKWPQEIINGYEALKKGEQKDMYGLWSKYTSRTGLPIEPNDKIYDEDTIKNQFITCGVCVALLLVSAFLCLRVMSRSMKVTGSGYSPAGGAEIPFTSMRKIDKRKWDSKGLAVIHYEEDGETKKAKVDGMVYGQFKEEDGAPAEALFTQIMENFKGEVIEFASDDDDDDEAEEETKKKLSKI
ncbi:MAG: hypothetical protein ACI9E1_001425 [Cryomorphaceae bacterium]|jgi:hypothetical protein